LVGNLWSLSQPIILVAVAVDENRLYFQDAQLQRQGSSANGAHEDDKTNRIGNTRPGTSRLEELRLLNQQRIAGESRTSGKRPAAIKPMRSAAIPNGYAGPFGMSFSYRAATKRKL
jgi:hypothetical protein